MIGFPQENKGDIEGILEVCKQVNNIGKKANKGRFKLHVSINTLIPKAHTPYQWVNMNTDDQLSDKYNYLISGLRKLGIKTDYPDNNASNLESLLSRGDRRLAQIIFQAWKNGAKFDAWHECFDVSFWDDALKMSAINPIFYTGRSIDVTETLPWDHISSGVSKEFLISEYNRSKDSETTLDCREKCLNCGIQMNFKINCNDIRFGKT